jgi:hypothetical protein
MRAKTAAFAVHLRFARSLSTPRRRFRTILVVVVVVVVTVAVTVVVVGVDVAADDVVEFELLIVSHSDAIHAAIG